MSLITKDGQRKEPCPDCEIYLAALYELTRKDFTFTEEELRELKVNGRSLDPLIEELEGGKGA
jgi:hypothetical protein